MQKNGPHGYPMASIAAHTSVSSASVTTRSRSAVTVATGRPTNGLWGTFSRLAAQLNAARAYASERAAVWPSHFAPTCRAH
jgi:hypothetical protein